ncbi:MAG: hypothetical protein M3Q97_09565, partial [Bacteroidota bacterium]|nr:hypothetical protein [Bacteroidota bacterium]
IYTITPSASIGGIRINGNPKSQTLIVVNYPGADSIPAKDRPFLKNILLAARIKLDHAAWVNEAAGSALTWEMLSSASNADFILTFGVTENALPAGMNYGEIYTVDNKRVVRSHSLATIETDQNKKKILWTALREIYGL